MWGDSFPLVSILIPCHNTEQWIGRAIESALSQTWPNKEILVFDDGSQDRSLEIIRSFGDRIKWESGPNRGANAARNRLLEMSRGDWLQYLDADDYLLNEKIAGQIASIADLDSADVLFSPMTLELWNAGFVVRRIQLPIPPPHDPWTLLARWSMPGTHAVLSRRSAITEIGGWAPEQPCCQEHELYFRMLAAGKRFVYSPRIGAIYRKWSSTTLCTRDPLLTLNNRLKILDRLAAHLEKSGELTTDRSLAIGQVRVECARAIYQYDPEAAIRLSDVARQECATLRLQHAACFPAAYRLAYQAFGFATAERLASTSRQSRSWISHAWPSRSEATRGSASNGGLDLSPLPKSEPGVTQASEQPTAGRAIAMQRVSILIPCFNAEPWIGHAIRSALLQTWPNKEVIVVDDGSTDGSPAVIRSFGSAIQFELGPHQGGNATRNRLLELADGDWLQYLDADDYLLPEKIERQLREMNDPPWVDVAYSPVILEHWDRHRPIRHETVPIPFDDLWVNLIRWLLPQTGAALWRRSTITDVGGWKTDQPCCQEHELYLRLLMQDKYFRFCPTPGAVYRQWSSQTVCRRDPQRTALERLAIVDTAERHLKQLNALNADRRNAIACTRLETARTLFQLDKTSALEIASMAKAAHPNHALPALACFPRAYRSTYQLAGFHTAEVLAAAVRPWRNRAKRTAQ
jgi:glycosyltransferase involved in cell wall biosynthesis